MTGEKAIDPHRAGLSAEDQQRLDSWLDEFDQCWNKDRLAAWVRKLPELGDRLRRPALIELVMTDMERRWQLGKRPLLEAYLKILPELGTPATVAPILILAEYEIRAQLGASTNLDEFAQRFPGQIERVNSLLERARQSDSTSPSVVRSPETVAPGPSAPPPVAAHDVTTSGMPDVLGRYRILRRLGRGHMGSVFLAEDTHLGARLVALKIPHFKPDDDPDILQRFYREARVTAKIEHPNLCRVFDVGAIDGTHFLTMEYIEGDSMSELLKSGKPLSQRQIAGFVCRLALAMQEAHNQGVIHRDLKPDNIMFHQKRGPVIVDFGLARRFDKDEAILTQSNGIVGTPAYMSPEQIDRDLQELSPGCDIYSLGVVLYELLAGQRPFQGKLLDVLAKILTQEPEPPSVYRPDLDPMLEAICLKAMTKKVENRYASMEDFAAALTEYLQATPATTQRAPAEQEPSEHDRGAEPDGPATPWLRFVVGGAVTLIFLLAIALFLLDRSGTKTTNPSGGHDHRRGVNDGFVKPVHPNDEGLRPGTPRLPRVTEVARTDKGGGNPPLSSDATPGVEVGNSDSKAVVAESKTVPDDSKQVGRAPTFSGENEQGDGVLLADRRSKSQGKTAPNTERQIAEWVLEHGGAVILHSGVQGEITERERLPAEISVQCVWFRHNAVGDDGLRKIKSLRNLQNLDASATDITDAGLEIIGEMRGLVYLFIADNPMLTDEGLKHIEALRKLGCLGLVDTKITDRGMKSISKLRSLTWLGLERTEITDAGLAQITDLRALADLRLTGTRVTREGIRRFKIAVPTCRIEE